MSKQNEPEGEPARIQCQRCGYLRQREIQLCPNCQPLGTCEFSGAGKHTYEQCTDRSTWRPVSAPSPQTSCPHERLDEEGICRKCGCDCRGIPAPAPSPIRHCEKCGSDWKPDLVSSCPDCAPVPEPARTKLQHKFDESHICIACGHSQGWVENWRAFECIPEVPAEPEARKDELGTCMFHGIPHKLGDVGNSALDCKDWKPVAEASPEAPANADDYRKLPLDAWFFCDTPSCLERYSVQRRTEGGCKIVCSTPYTHDNAKKDILEIVRLHEAVRLSVLSGSQEAPTKPSATPDGYAYRYHDGIRHGTNGRSINGSMPIEVIPFYYGKPPAPEAEIASLDCAQNVMGLQESALAKLREQIDGAQAILDPEGNEGA